ncbi:MAG TPA: EAL domain-containing protein, partial [Rhodocyclaceae bacterium]|nr:EAL domain-containing protein [Rhodocyclaceae bacterium]
IVAVGAWVLQEACRQTAVWHAAGYPHLTVAVNLSGRQVSDGSLVATVREALANTGLPASALELELTESMLMHDAPAVESLLDELRRMGVALSVDDFGTGYSSLAYLKRFPLDTLKVDRSFVRDITADPDDASITRAVIQMAHELSLKVVAEGVETAAQLQLLAACGCDQIQGYYFSPPLPAAVLGELLIEQRVIDESLLRHRSDQVRVALIGPFDAPMTALAEQLESAGNLVQRFATVELVRAWLVDHGCDVLVGKLAAPFAAADFSIFGESAVDPRRAVILLADAAAWPALQGNHGIAFDAVVPWPAAPQAVLATISRLIEHRRLRGEVQRLEHDNRQLGSRLSQEDSRHLSDRDSLRSSHGDSLRSQINQADAALTAPPQANPAIGIGLGSWLSNALRHTEVALFGIDIDGWLVFANPAAEQLFSPDAALIGRRAGEVLPDTLVDAAGVFRQALAEREILLADRWWQVNVLPLDDRAAQGWLVILTPHLVAVQP